jgi:hypothetical protein
MGKKLLVSLAMEGKLDGGGLQATNEDDDVLTAMARELVTRQGVGEEAAAVWRSLQHSRDERTVGTAATETKIVESALAAEEPANPAIEEDPHPWVREVGFSEQLTLF